MSTDYCCQHGYGPLDISSELEKKGVAIADCITHTNASQDGYYGYRGHVKISTQMYTSSFRYKSRQMAQEDAAEVALRGLKDERQKRDAAMNGSVKTQGSGEILCRNCHIGFHKQWVKAHMTKCVQHAMDRAGKRPCQVCKKPFDTLRQVKVHERIAHPQGNHS